MEELVLGKPPDYSDEPAAKTKAAYYTILGDMKNLKELEMLEPNLQRLSMGKQRVIQATVKWEMSGASCSSRTCRG